MAAQERTVLVRPRTVLSVLGIGLGVAVVVWVLWSARNVVGWIVVAILLAIALDPAVQFFVGKGMRRVYAALLAFAIAVVAIGGLFYLVIPPLVDQITEFVQAVPGLLQELSEGRGPFGFLEREYQIVERTREAIEKAGVQGVFGLADPALSVARGVVTAVVGVVTISFMTLFMLIDGRRLLRVLLDLLPESVLPRWERAGLGIYKTVGGYVTGNIALSIIAGVLAWAALQALGVPYAVPLGVVVAIFDLIPLAGATISGVIVILVALATEGWVIALIFGIYFLVYQQLENHVLQPIVYRRTVAMSPVVVIIAVLIGADIAGIIGALIAIPIGGSIQVIAAEALSARRERLHPDTARPAEAAPSDDEPGAPVSP
jgi:predicted PurR-regulated permease PerM